MLLGYTYITYNYVSSHTMKILLFFKFSIISAITNRDFHKKYNKVKNEIILLQINKVLNLLLF